MKETNLHQLSYTELIGLRNHFTKQESDCWYEFNDSLSVESGRYKEQKYYVDALNILERVILDKFIQDSKPILHDSSPKMVY